MWYRAFWAMSVGISLIKGDDMFHSQHHGTELLLCNLVDDSSVSGCEMCQLKLDGADFFDNS
jgi:hypothetical protein